MMHGCLVAESVNPYRIPAHQVFFIECLPALPLIVNPSLVIVSLVCALVGLIWINAAIDGTGPGCAATREKAH